MKNKFRRVISALLAVLLVTVCASMLFACNKNNDKAKDAQLRAENVAVLKDKILNAVDDKWTGEMDNSALAELSNAGDYVTAAGWADMVCGVFRKSALQTGKLTSLKNYVLSADGQKLLDDFEGNAELLIPLMRAANFTPTDISNLTYDLLCALVSDSGELIDAMISRLAELKRIVGINADTAENIEKNSIDLAVIKREFVPNAQEKEQMLRAFADAKAPMSEIVEFAYNMSIGSITDNIFNALFSADGALSNISNGEIRTVVDTLIRNAGNLKTALDDNAIEDLNRAVGLIIAKFDKNNVSSTLYAQVVQYAKYAYMFVDVIPALCDVMGSAGKALDNDLIEQLRNVAAADLDDNTQRVNEVIITAKLVLQAGADFNGQQLGALIDKIGAQVGDEFKKTLPLFALDMALNMSAWLQDMDANKIVGKHPEIIGDKEVEIMVGTILLNFGLDNAKQKYRDYLNGECPFTTVMSAVYGCGFDSFGIENPYNPSLAAQAADWFEYYMVNGVEQASEKALAVCNKAVSDIKQFINDFYAQGSESKALISKIADWQLLTENLMSAEYLAYEQEIMKSDLIGIICLISMALK